MDDHLNILRFSEDIYQMTGYRPGTYWQWTWRYIGPVIMTCILVSSVVCLAIDKPTYSAYKAEEVTHTLIDNFDDDFDENINVLNKLCNKIFDGSI